jgi:vacuolar-type H+-ATPase subunit E/Vma4
MDTIKTTAEISEGDNQGTTDIMADMAKEADQIISNARQTARKEAEQEMERILKQYEEKTKQIVSRIREETNTRAAEIADSVRESIMTRIEKASSDAIAEAIGDSSRKVEELVKNQPDLAVDKLEPAPAKAKIDQESNPPQLQEKNITEQDNGDIVKDEKNPTEAKTSTPKAHPDVRFEQDFDQWLSQ